MIMIMIMLIVVFIVVSYVTMMIMMQVQLPLNYNDTHCCRIITPTLSSDSYSTGNNTRCCCNTNFGIVNNNLLYQQHQRQRQQQRQHLFIQSYQFTVIKHIQKSRSSILRRSTNTFLHRILPTLHWQQQIQQQGIRIPFRRQRLMVVLSKSATKISNHNNNDNDIILVVPPIKGNMTHTNNTTRPNLNHTKTNMNRYRHNSTDTIAKVYETQQQQQHSASNNNNNNNSSNINGVITTENLRSKVQMIQQQMKTGPKNSTHDHHSYNNDDTDIMRSKDIIISQSYFDYLYAECIAQNQLDIVSNLTYCCIQNNNNNNIDLLNHQNAIQVQYSTYQSCLQACFQHVNAMNAIQILNIMMNNNNDTAINTSIQPQIKDYVLVLLTICRNDMKPVELSKSSIRDRNNTRNDDDHIYADNNSNKNYNYKMAIQLLNDIKMTQNTDVPVIVYDAILSCLLHHNYKDQWKTSVQILHSMIFNNNDDKNNINNINKTMIGTGSSSAISTSSKIMNNNNTFITTKPILSTYRIVIEHCIMNHQINTAFNILQLCIKQYKQQPSIQLTSYVFEIVIVALTSSVSNYSDNKSRNNSNIQWRRAIQLLDTMIELHIPRTITIYNNILIACSKVREPYITKSVYIQRMKRHEQLYQYNTNINNNKYYKNHNNQTISTNITSNNNQNKKCIIRPNIITYNAILGAYCTCPTHWRDALLVFDEIQRLPGIVPDICSYTNAIRACVKGGKTQRALSLIQVVKDKGLPLDSYFYTAAIEASDWSNAVTLLNEMEQNGITPTEISYSVTIKACGKSGQWEIALNLLESMRQKKYMRINIYVYNAALAALATAAKQRMKLLHFNSASSNKNSTNHPDSTNNNSLLSMKVKSLLSKMQLDNIQPDGFTYTSAISCYGSEGLWEEAIQLIDVMEHGNANIQPNKVAYTAAITTCGRSGQCTIAKELFQKMKQRGHVPDTMAYNALFSAYRMANSTDDVYELWKEMIGNNTAMPKVPTGKHVHPNNKNIPLPAVPYSQKVYPDIITVTEAIGALSLKYTNETIRYQIDQIITDSINHGILLNEDILKKSSLLL